MMMNKKTTTKWTLVSDKDTSLYTNGDWEPATLHDGSTTGSTTDYNLWNNHEDELLKRELIWNPWDKDDRVEIWRDWKPNWKQEPIIQDMDKIILSKSQECHACKEVIQPEDIIMLRIADERYFFHKQCMCNPDVQKLIMTLIVNKELGLLE